MNQNPEQIARDNVDKQLTACGWVIQSIKQINLNAGIKQAGATKFNEEQMLWLRMIKDYVVNSFHIDKDDFDLNTFNAQGGLGKMWQLFGDNTEEIINELNEVLAA